MAPTRFKRALDENLIVPLTERAMDDPFAADELLIISFEGCDHFSAAFAVTTLPRLLSPEAQANFDELIRWYSSGNYPPKPSSWLLKHSEKLYPWRTR